MKLSHKTMGLSQNEFFIQDRGFCLRTVHYILVHFSILQQSQVIAAVAKVSCKHGLWLVDRVNKKEKRCHFSSFLSFCISFTSSFAL